MPEERSLTNKGVFSAVVCANRQIGQSAASFCDYTRVTTLSSIEGERSESHRDRRFYRLRLEFSGTGAEAFSNFKPGQFAELDLCDTALPPAEMIPEDLSDASERKILLRRPFSFADVTVEGSKTFVEVLYRVVGPATLRMTTLAAGNSISIIGPLGNGFWVPKGKKIAVLVAGGMGAPPIEHLAKILTADYPSIEVIALAGAKTANELPFEGRLDEISRQLGFSLPGFARYGIKSVVATDDGSAGYHGPVTDCLSEWLSQPGLVSESVIIYSCGPEAMQAKVAEIAKKKKIDCQVSMERRMACGFGVCQSCAVECRISGLNETIYKLCCQDGPVFDSREVVF